MQVLVWTWAQLSKGGAGQVVLVPCCWGTRDRRAGGYWVPQSKLWRLQVVGKINYNLTDFLLNCTLSFNLQCVCRFVACCQRPSAAQTRLPRRCCTCDDWTPAEWFRSLHLWGGGRTRGQEHISWAGITRYFNLNFDTFTSILRCNMSSIITDTFNCVVTCLFCKKKCVTFTVKSLLFIRITLKCIARAPLKALRQ